MLSYLFSKPNMIYTGTEDVSFTTQDGKQITGKRINFEDQNESDGDLFVSSEKLGTVSIPDHRCTGTLKIKVTTGKYTKVEYRGFTPDED